MSTIASPRPSLSQTPSRRTSSSTINTTTTDAAGADRGSLRRTKAAALRDYYGLNASATPPRESLEEQSELDKASFDPQAYVAGLLKNESMPALFRAEVGLVQEVRALEGEKKALVYDNYSKLIAATHTIARMRDGMDPMTPATRSLGPAVAHIAETASALSAERKMGDDGGAGSGQDVVEDARKKREGKETVRWALSAPQRLRELAEQGKTEEAEKESRDVLALLDKWEGVKGVEDLRKACTDAMQAGEGEG